MADTDDFYQHLPRITAFGQLTQSAHYTPLPADWWVGVADIVNSTGLIDKGQYKAVNMVGAAVISAMMNALKKTEFPFIFGGDGAGFALPSRYHDVAAETLSRVARWAQAEFGFEMRVALVPAVDIRAAGKDVRVARFQVSEGAAYAMFEGGGLYWAETRMKAGDYRLDPSPVGAVPDLTGLSCRWSPMPARNGTILSILVAPMSDADPGKVAQVYDQVVTLAQGLERGGHPAPVEGPGTDWPPAGAILEAHAASGGGSLALARAKALFESLMAWLLIRTGLTLGGFDARRYAREVAANADFRKLDDGLKMTLDCDPETRQKIEAILAEAQAAGVVRFGTATQAEAMMTCIVPSMMSDDHVHFIDGAAGGYTLAASRMKQLS